MRKLLLTALSAATLFCASAAVPAYDQAAALQKAQSDVANWMSYLPDDVFVAHVSIPGTHDTATADGWESSTGPTYSTTQAVNLDNQLLQGIRAFDFRPGLYKNELWCNHGTDRTSLKLADAFKKLTDYLDAHPGEFFVIHLFRGNVPNAGSSLTGGANSDSDREQYNQLFDKLFNQELNDYIIDYTPMLKVKDMRGKMVIFRRDRINFAHISKAGYLWNWPSDSGEGTENNVVSVEHATDSSVTGILYATDISSPDDATALNNELNSLTGIFEKSSSQAKPNDEKREKGRYKPYWTMPFTSGCYGKFLIADQTSGYIDNATHTNPHFTQLLRDAQQAGTTGPAGTVFSDWVLVDTHNNKAVQGVDLVKSIYENNFYYIKDYILDDELFTAEEELPMENIWDETKWYYMRNAATGQYLSGGLWWGTHANLETAGIMVQPKVLNDERCYYLHTELQQGGTQNNHLGTNMYVDNNSSADRLLLRVVHAEGGKVLFTFDSDNDGIDDKALGAFKQGGFFDSEYNVDAVEINANDPMQQWELVESEERYRQDLASLPNADGVDLTYRIGHFTQNGPYNDSWNVKSGGSSTTAEIIGAGESNHFPMLGFTNAKKGWTANKTSWSLNKEITGLKPGTYRVYYKSYNSNHADHHVTINGVSKSFSNDDTTGTTTAADALNAMMNGGHEYMHEVEVGSDGKLTIQANCGTTNHGSATATYFADFRVIYFGSADMAAVATAQKVQEAIDEVTAYVATLPVESHDGFGDDITPYQTLVDNLAIEGDGSKEIAEIKALKRKYLFRNTIPGFDFTEGIDNHSFETGTTEGWNVISSSDTGVKPNTNGTYTTEGIDGDYLFNTYWQGTPLTQVIPGLPAGKYRLEVLMASGDGDSGATPHVFFLINGEHSDVYALSKDKTKFQNLSYEFNVGETKDVEIGVIGGDDNGNFVAGGHWWYKADNFRLTYVSEPETAGFYKALQAAIDEATATVNTIPEDYRTGWTAEMAPYQAIVDNKTLVGDGSTEIAEIQVLMQQYILGQDFEDADMSKAILNNSFELGNLNHWTAEVRGDTGVKENANGTYHVDNADGIYLYNTWDQASWGADISQTVDGLHPGIYRLEALLTTDPDQKVTLFVNDETETITATSTTEFVTAKIEFKITEDNSSITLGARQEDHWFKADNFRLIFVSPFKELETPANTVTTTFQMIEGETYYILGNHDTDGLHAMCHDFSGIQVVANSNSDVSHVAVKAKPFILALDENGFCLIDAAATMSTRAASEPEYRIDITADGTNIETSIKDAGGRTLGFNQSDKTFSFENGHSQPAMLYTAAYDPTYTGIDGIETDIDANAVYYNLQGVKVDNPTSGVYIKRTDNKIKKVMIK